VLSTVGEFFAAKLRNSAKRHENNARLLSTSEKHAVQHCEKLRKSFSLNYKSAALLICAIGHRITELCAWSEATLYISRLELSGFSAPLPRTDFRCS